ncbi:hypothetical protein QBC45DRAFT_434233 [Copromyces sp. CBS 386.78]|nr:hypothetical protein QBC45DRAFT_434233 [Copromyces sp. CBS 386.78]
MVPGSRLPSFQGGYGDDGDGVSRPRLVGLGMTLSPLTFWVVLIQIDDGINKRVWNGTLSQTERPVTQFNGHWTGIQQTWRFPGCRHLALSHPGHAPKTPEVPGYFQSSTRRKGSVLTTENGPWDSMMSDHLVSQQGIDVDLEVTRVFLIPSIGEGSVGGRGRSRSWRCIKRRPSAAPAPIIRPPLLPSSKFQQPTHESTQTQNSSIAFSNCHSASSLIASPPSVLIAYQRLIVPNWEVLFFESLTGNNVLND